MRVLNTLASVSAWPIQNTPNNTSVTRPITMVAPSNGSTALWLCSQASWEDLVALVLHPPCFKVVHVHFFDHQSSQHMLSS